MNNSASMRLSQSADKTKNDMRKLNAKTIQKSTL